MKTGTCSHYSATPNHLPRVGVLGAILLGCAFAAGQTPGHGGHPLMPNQELFLQCRIGRGAGARVIDTPLALTTYGTARVLDQPVALPPPFEPLRIKRYLTRAVLRQRARPAAGPGARPLVLLALKGPTQSYERWLVAGDDERNRLISFIGTWRFMRVDPGEHRDKLLEAFAGELTRPPMLIVSRPDGTGAQRVPAQEHTPHELEDLGGSVVVREFFPHFAFDEKQGHPVNRSDKRINPAALVEIRVGERVEQRWVFAKFPKFNSGKNPLPLQVRLDCPVEPQRPVPDFALVAVGGKTLELWTRHEGTCRAKKLAVDEAVQVPGSSYAFRVARFLPAGELREQYAPGAGRDAVRVIEISYTGARGVADTLWLPMGKARNVKTARGELTLWFGPRVRSPAAPARPPAP